MSKMSKIRQSVVMGHRVFLSRIYKSRIFKMSKMSKIRQSVVMRHLVFLSRIYRIFRSRIFKIFRSRIFKIFKMRKSASNNFRLQFLPIHVIILIT